MKDLLAIAAQNTIVAGILAILVYGLTRVWRRPPVAHLLWLVVLAKLVGPPVLPVDVMGLFARRVAIESRDGGRDLARADDVSGGQASFRLSRGSQGPRSRIPSGTPKTNPKRPPRPTMRRARSPHGRACPQRASISSAGTANAALAGIFWPGSSDWACAERSRCRRIIRFRSHDPGNAGGPAALASHGRWSWPGSWACAAFPICG